VELFVGVGQTITCSERNIFLEAEDAITRPGTNANLCEENFEVLGWPRPRAKAMYICIFNLQLCVVTVTKVQQKLRLQHLKMETKSRVFILRLTCSDGHIHYIYIHVGHSYMCEIFTWSSYHQGPCTGALFLQAEDRWTDADVATLSKVQGQVVVVRRRSFTVHG
jgi:hypothetical protein